MGVNIGSGITIEGGISIVIDDGTPYNTVAPVISVATPNVRVGKTLTSTTGTWNGSYPTLGYYYQWLDNGSNIANATSNTYVIQSSDLGNYLTSNVIAYSSYGNSLPATSNSLGPVLPAIVAPTIGDFVYGGYYAGTTTISSVLYYLIVSDSSVGQGITNYNTAYTNCNALVSNGYSDWVLPTFAETQQMDSVSSSPTTWPSGQQFNRAPSTSTSNYWATAGYPVTGLTSCWNFYYNTTESIYGTNSSISYRAVRYEPIPT